MTALFVKNGDLVEEGAPLFVVDTSHVLAGGGTLDAAVTDGLRRQLALLEEQITAEQGRMRSEGERLSTRIQGLASELSSLETQRSLQSDRASVTQARLKALSELRAKGYVSEAEYRVREEAWLSQRQALAAIEQRVTALTVDMNQVRIERDRAPLDSGDRLSRLLASQTEIRQRLAETEAQRGQLVRASRPGRVTSLQVALGQQLDPTKPVLTVIPEGATLQAELYVPSRAIGFVKAGQQVKLMYDAFPHQSFGTYDGKITAVSQTMLSPREVVGPIQPIGSSYIITVQLDDGFINIYGKPISLQSDMTIKADIVLEKLTIFQNILKSANIIYNND